MQHVQLINHSKKEKVVALCGNFLTLGALLQSGKNVI